MGEDKWPEPCTCTPGSESSGWSEVRSPECQAHERQQWADMFKRLPEFIAKMKKRS